MPSPARRTDAIWLREIERGDLQRIAAWRGSRELYAWLAGDFRGSDPAAEEAWFANYAARRSSDVRFAICLGESGEHIGNVYLLDIDPQSRSAEFHIFIAEPAHRGRGFGEAATRACLDCAFHERALQTVYLRVLEDNRPALALYEKCGFTRQGVESRTKDGREVRLVRMALCRP